MKTISSRQNPTVRLFRDLADAPDVTGARLLLDGAHLVREARDAGLQIETACVAASQIEQPSDEGDLARTLDREGIPVVLVTAAVLAALSPVRSPSGIVAVAHRRPVTPDRICSHSSPWVLIAADVQDPGNVGALLRVAEAAGVTGAFIAGRSASPFSWKAVRGSMGSVLRLPVVAGMPLRDVITCLHEHRIRTVAAVARDGRDPDAVNWRGSIALLVGGEGAGLPDAVVRASDERVTIPMAVPVESLNVAAAGAILLYAARRQRHA